MDLDTIKKIIAIAEEAEIAELEVEQEGFRVLVRKHGSGAPVAMATVPSAPVPAASPAHEPEAAAAGHFIESPMVATFYRAPAPDAAPFVKVGDQVTPDTVVCILEAMKVMNEIKAGVSGTIEEILVENAQPVEFSQQLFRVNIS